MKAKHVIGGLFLLGVAWWLFRPETEQERTPAPGLPYRNRAEKTRFLEQEKELAAKDRGELKAG